MNPHEYDYLEKIVLVGDSGVGKSSIMLRYCDNQFSESFITTIGVDFKIKTLNNVFGKIVKLQIWDTAGQDRFRTITSSYYRGANCVMIFFDLTNLESFKNLQSWIDEISRYTTKTTMFLVGTKSDLIDRIVVTDEMIQTFAKQRNLVYVKTSSKTNEGVSDVFNKVAQSFVNERVGQENSIICKNPLVINPQPVQGSKCC